MNVAIAALALALAVVIIWHSCWHIIGTKSRTLGGWIGPRREPVVDEPATAPPAKLWIGQPVHPVLDLKAARVRPDTVAALPEPKPSRTAWSPDDDAELLRLAADGVPAAEIAAQLGRSEKTVLLRIPLARLRHRSAMQAAE
jgi:hypothetical protein